MKTARILFPSVCWAVMSTFATPTEYVWTGAQNAYWTNAANWQVAGAVASDVPGRIQVSGGGFSDNLDCTAVFGPAGAARPNIDTDGYVYASNVVVTVGAPAYLFGSATTGSGRYFGISPFGGRFVVEKGAAAPTIHLGCAWLSNDQGSLVPYGDPRTAIYINNAEEPLVFQGFEYKHPSVTTAARRATIGIGGTGDIKILSREYYGTQDRLSYHFYQSPGARLIFDCDLDNNYNTAYRLLEFAVGYLQIGVGIHTHIDAPGATGTVEITKGHTLPFRLNASDNYPLTAVGEDACLRFTGEGSVRFQSFTGNGNSAGLFYASTGLVTAHGGRIAFDCDVFGLTDSTGLYLADGDGGGTVSLGGANALTGPLDLLAQRGAPTFEMRSAQDLGSMSAVRMGGNATLSFVGSEPCTVETDLVITNKSPWFDYKGIQGVSREATVRQAGTAPFTVASSLAFAGLDGATLTLANDTAVEATWTGALTDETSGALAVTKTGAGAWTLAAANTYSGATTISAGKLVLAADGSLANSPVTVAAGATLAVVGEKTLAALAISGAAKLELAAGATLDVGAVQQAGGATLQVRAGDGAKIRIAGVAGSVPSWLTFVSENGLAVPAAVDGDGFISADATYWNGAATGDWTVAANWTAGVPTTARRAVIATDSVVEVPVGATPPAAGMVTVKAGTLSVRGSLEAEPELVGGTIAVKEGTLNIRNGWGVVGTGTLTVDSANGGQIDIMKDNTSTTRFGTGESTGVMSVTVGRRTFNGGAAGFVDFGASQKGTFRLTVQDAGPDKKQDPIFKGSSPRRTRLGVGSGLSEATLYGGCLQGANWGAHVAAALAADSAVTGRVHLVGGRLYAGSGYLDSSWSGLAIGISNLATVPAAVRGEVWLDEGGSVGVGSISPFGLGVGGAEGYCRQTGGAFEMSTVNNAAVAVLGYGSGTGEYILSNGTFSVNRPLFVGGCLKSDLELKSGTSATASTVTYSEVSSRPAGRGAATGRFLARGGTLTATGAKGIIVGADGKGRFEVGPAGSVTTTRLVVSNNVEGVLAYELGASGTGSLTATELVIAEGAKLEIDGRVLSAEAPTYVRLASCTTVEGSFAAENVTIRSSESNAKRFVGASVVTTRGDQQGLWLKLSPRGLLLLYR